MSADCFMSAEIAERVLHDTRLALTPRRGTVPHLALNQAPEGSTPSAATIHLAEQRPCGRGGDPLEGAAPAPEPTGVDLSDGAGDCYPAASRGRA